MDSSWAHTSNMPSPIVAPNDLLPNGVQKKPRHRHSPAQLVALNELFDKNEHPPLDQRTTLAERLGMETKTVNAWFQNKRASSKKRTRGAPYEAPTTNPLPRVHATSAPISHHHSELDDFHDDDYSSIDIHQRSASVAPHEHSLYYTGGQDHSQFLAEGENMPRRMRMRPSIEQTEELKQLYNINPHPTTEQRQALSERIGMRYQSITNWFQNQRSLAKKRKEDEADAAAFLSSNAPDRSYEPRQYSAFPPPSHHPSLDLPPPSSHPSLYHPARLRRSPSISPSMDDHSPRRSSRRSSTPYGSSSSFSRPRRSRPEPFQLEALKVLYQKTSTPTIEERSALALEIGMDIGKVTNWFRNLRQTARKRAKRTGSADDDDYDTHHGESYSASVSRSGTPSLHSSSSSMNDDSMDLDRDDYGAHSDYGSEDEYQEAVTPSPVASPSPPPSASQTVTRNYALSKSVAYHANLQKVSPTTLGSGVKIEDALLLLSFHHHIVH